MSKYAGTQTEKNLWAAFAGESEARNKYTEYVGAHDYSDGTSPAQNIVIEVDDQFVIVKDAKLVDKVYDNKDVAKNDAKYTNGTAAAFLCDEHEEVDGATAGKVCSDCNACLEHADGTPADNKCANCGECIHVWTGDAAARECTHCKAKCIAHDWDAQTGECKVCEVECPQNASHVSGTACDICGKK